MIPSKKSGEKPSQIRGINKKNENTKEAPKDPQKSQLQIFYTTKKDLYPLSRSHHEALELVLWKSSGK
jgi:hypothetical protein